MKASQTLVKLLATRVLVVNSKVKLKQQRHLARDEEGGMGHREERQRRAHTVSQSGFVSMTSAQMGFLFVPSLSVSFSSGHFFVFAFVFLLLSSFCRCRLPSAFFAASLCATLQLLQRMACPADSEQRWYTGLPTGAVRGVPCFAGDRAAETSTALPAAVQIALSDHVLFKFRAYTVCLVLFCALRICCDPLCRCWDRCL